MTGSQYINNFTQGGSGGAIAYEPWTTKASNLNLSYITFTGNTARSGGAVEVYVQSTNEGTANRTISGCLFANNNASIIVPDFQNYGGGLDINQYTSATANVTLTVQNSTFYQNDS